MKNMFSNDHNMIRAKLERSYFFSTSNKNLLIVREKLDWNKFGVLIMDI